MKKLILVVLFMLLAGIALATDLPTTDLGSDGNVQFGLANMSAGSYYDVRNRQVLAGAQCSVLDIKHLISADIGILTDAHSNPWMFGIGVDVSVLAQMCKLNYDLPANLHLVTFIARDLSLDWNDGGRWGFGAIVRF